jgi:hypothetical protein
MTTANTRSRGEKLFDVEADGSKPSLKCDA